MINRLADESTIRVMETVYVLYPLQSTPKYERSITLYRFDEKYYKMYDTGCNIK